jgi:STE24 endopeptidase
LGELVLSQILSIFIGAKIVQTIIETILASLNRSYYLDPGRQSEVCRLLSISKDDFAKTLAYTLDKYRFGIWANWISTSVLLVFLASGGLGIIESAAKNAAALLNGGDISVGLIFFAILGALSFLLSTPVEIYQTFVIEEKHGFNRQTWGGFVTDRVKGLVLGCILGGALLACLLYVMAVMGQSWWLWAWLVISAFSLVAAWIYPTFLAPIFNKFTPIEDGELKTKIYELANLIGFRSGGIFVMDASTRSTHGNAYFTGVFGEKRIVLFDTLLKSLNVREIVAVLAHELGHFKLHHVRWGVLRGLLTTGGMFYLLSLCLPLDIFYSAFGLGSVSNYGALVVFTMWFGLVEFLLQPLGSYVSRRNEFAADRFAKSKLASGEDLVEALIKLRESNHTMPLSHPWYSRIYYSHPPLTERLAALRSLN